MKATGDVRKIDQLDRVVISKLVKIEMDLLKKDPIEIFVDQDMIITRKYYPTCTFCGDKKKDEDEIIQFSGKTFCKFYIQIVTAINDQKIFYNFINIAKKIFILIIFLFLAGVFRLIVNEYNGL